MDDQPDDDEALLLSAAANWAEEETSDTKESSPPNKPQSSSGTNSNDNDKQQQQHATNNNNNRSEWKPEPPKKTYSLHVTQLSYEATDYDIRDLFMSKGCLVTSVRLVYTAQDSETMIRKFKGVAFVDVSDEASFAVATKLHRTYHLGRRINVRPTLSPEDLVRIAEATKEKVNDMIQAAHAITDAVDNTDIGNSSSGGSKQNSKPRSADKTSKAPRADNKRKTNPSTATSEDAAVTNKAKKSNDTKSDKSEDRRRSNPRKEHKPRLDDNGEERKLTKKERNQKAAILIARRGRRRR